MNEALEQLKAGVKHRGSGRKPCAYCDKESDVYLVVRVVSRGNNREDLGSASRTVCAEDALRVLTEFRELP